MDLAKQLAVTQPRIAQLELPGAKLSTTTLQTRRRSCEPTPRDPLHPPVALSRRTGSLSLRQRCPDEDDRCRSLKERGPSLRHWCPNKEDRGPSLEERGPSLQNWCPNEEDRGPSLEERGPSLRHWCPNEEDRGQSL